MTEPQDPQPNYPTYPGATPTPPEAAPTPPGAGPVPPGMTPFPTDTPTHPAERGPVYDGKRPGTVLAAGLITILLSLGTLITSIAIFVARTDAVNRIQDYIRDHPADFNVKASDLPTDSEIRSTLTAFAVIFLVVAVIGIGLGIATLGRQNWARILLIIAASLTAIAAILPSLGLVGLPWLAGSIAVVVLLLTGKTKAWFAAARAV